MGFFSFQGTILGGPYGDGSQPIPTIHVHPRYFEDRPFTDEEYSDYIRTLGPFKRFLLNLLGVTTIYGAMKVPSVENRKSAPTVFGRIEPLGDIQTKPGIYWFSKRKEPIPKPPGGSFPGYALGREYVGPRDLRLALFY